MIDMKYPNGKKIKKLKMMAKVRVKVMVKVKKKGKEKRKMMKMNIIMKKIKIEKKICMMKLAWVVQDNQIIMVVQILIKKKFRKKKSLIVHLHRMDKKIENLNLYK